MRLRELDAEWIGNWHELGFMVLPNVEGAQGVLYQCPKCAIGKPRGNRASRRGDVPDTTREWFEGAHYFLNWFLNPRNAPPVPDDEHPLPGRWLFTGDGIDFLTLAGSVQLTAPPGCGAHFYIQNGEIVNA